MESFIDPKVLARVKDLPFIAKTIANGFLQGLHASQMRGMGMEFSQYRSYEPGDELAKIDWKLFARSDRYFVREAERESETNIVFVLDCSASMLQRSHFTSNEQQSHWNKLQYAQHLIATLAYIGLQQGDNVGLLSLADNDINYLPALNTKPHWFRLVNHLTELSSNNVKKFVNKQDVKQYIEQIPQGSLVLFLSDFYQQENEIFDVLRQLCHSNNYLEAWPIYCHDELTFPYDQAITFKDLESQESIFVSSKEAKKHYLDLLSQHQHSLSQQFNDLNIAQHQVDIDLPLDHMLQQYLQTRLRKNR